MDHAVYMDHNATTPVRPAAADAVANALAATGNASSVHRFGRLARRTLEDARARVAALVGGTERNVVFTSGGTEANNLALGGCGRNHILVSSVEHPSVLECAAHKRLIPVDWEGVVDIAALDQLLLEAPAPALVSIMLANNETGVLQPVAEAAEIAHRHGALFHCDAVQAAGRIKVDMKALAVDMLTLSSHKLGGPSGVGALVFADGTNLQALLTGGGQEKGLRPGTENTAGIAGFGVAAELAGNEFESFAALGHLRDGLESRVTGAAPKCVIFGAGAERLANTSCISMPGVDSETQVMALDLAGIAVSAGSACSSGKVGQSHVLTAMRGETPETKCAIRASLGWTTKAGDIDKFLDAWAALYGRASLGCQSAMPAA